MGIKNNTTELQKILTIINELPEASEGVELPELTNEGTVSDMLAGKQLIDQEGNIVTGTIPTKTSSNLTASGATVTVPAGYYATQVSKSVATATRADTTISVTADDTNDKLTITASNNQSTGYVTGSNKTATKTISLTASGATVTASDGTNKVSKSVATATQATPSVSINSSGLITASATQTAGYVTAGTKSGTKQLTTQAAKTITPSTSSQTAVASGVYTTGAITVAAIPSDYVKPSGTKSITENGTHDVKSYASVNVNVAEDLDTELNTQEEKLNELLAILDTKATGGGSDNSEIASNIVDGTITTYTDSKTTKIRNFAFAYCSNLTTASFPKCTNIGSSAFTNCSSLTSISLSKCKTMAAHAFAYCTNLTTASFPVCTYIGNNAFRACSNLTIASFPVCTNIGMDAFNSCTKLTIASFPKCTSIGNYAFYSCSSLTSVSFPLCSYIGNSAFCSCSSLTSVSFPNCTSIGNYAFAYCSNLTTASFSVCTNIGSSAFYSCSRLTTASFPKCTTIGNYAFQHCTKLSALVLANSTICTLSNSNVFTGTPIASKTGYIYVPRNRVSNYQTATNWAYFSTQISAIEDSEYWDGSDLGGSDYIDLISFQITNSYQAEKDMTWAQWCDSIYNTDGYYISDGYVLRNSDSIVAGDAGYVASTDVIIANEVYWEEPY